jgi:hypothetical protein
MPLLMPTADWASRYIEKGKKIVSSGEAQERGVVARNVIINFDECYRASVKLDRFHNSPSGCAEELRANRVRKVPPHLCNFAELRAHKTKINCARFWELGATSPAFQYLRYFMMRSENGHVKKLAGVAARIYVVCLPGRFGIK